MSQSTTWGAASRSNGRSIQTLYYERTSVNFDSMHRHDRDEHGFAFAYMVSMIDYLGITSVLDVGSGTGFALLKLKQQMPKLKAVGIEPSAAQRRIGHQKGLSENDLLAGDATHLPFPDCEFDLVCEFGALHHMEDPGKAVSEMLRVARKAIFICDVNNFGQGSSVVRTVKQALHTLGLWPVANFVKTRGRGFSFSEGDGVMYSYSVFANRRQIAEACTSVHFLNTASAGPNLYRSASHVALLGIIRQP